MPGQIYDEADRDLLVAIFVALKHLLDRRASEKSMDDNSAANT